MHPVTNADRDAMSMPPEGDAATYHGAGCRGERRLCGRGDARRLRGAEGCRHGVGGRHGHRRQHQGRDHGGHKKDMGKFGRFHKHDPPLIVEIIVDVRGNRLMTRL